MKDDHKSVSPKSTLKRQHHSMSNVMEIAKALDEIEQAMILHDLWNADVTKSPSPQAFESTVPFCLDTMPFENWLQYVLIDKLRDMLFRAQHDPSVLQDLSSLKLKLHPVAEEYWRGQWREHRQLLLALRRLDDIFSQN